MGVSRGRWIATNVALKIRLTRLRSLPRDWSVRSSYFCNSPSAHFTAVHASLASDAPPGHKHRIGIRSLDTLRVSLATMASSKSLHVLITGATGLVGQGVLRETLRDATVTSVTLLGRHAAGCEDQRVNEVIVTDFSDLSAVEDQLHGIDACLYCAGAPPVGTPEDTYRHVTVALTTSVAGTLGRLNPGMRFLYISGANADAKSWFMPLRVKGEAELALQALPIHMTLLRPGGIQPAHGERSPHRMLRALYAVGAPLMGIGVAVAPSLMTSTERLGRAMLALAQMPDPPAIVENADINRLGAS